MSAQKEKRLSKLKKIKIWPHVVGLIVFFMLFSLTLAIMSGGFVASMISGKLSQSGLATVKYAEMIENSEDAELCYDSIRIGNPDISGILIIGKNGETLVAKDMEAPDLNNVHVTARYQDIRSFDVYIDADGALGGMVYFDNSGNVKVNEAEFSNAFADYFKSDDSDDIYISDFAVIEQGIWFSYAMPSGRRIMLRNIVRFNLSDITQVLYTAIIVAIFGLIIMVFHICSLVSTIRDKKKIHDALYTDVITGGKNWEWFDRRAEEYIYKNRKNKYRYALIHIRMEKYRSYCSCYGLSEGEELIEDIYKQMQRLINGKELAAHKDFADFGLLLIYNTEDELFNRVCGIKQSLEALRPDRKLYFTAGICTVTSPDDDVTMLYNNAGMARSMLASQNDAKVAWFNKDMQAAQLWERRVEDDMERALANHEFQVYLQPKYSTKDEKLSGAEALVRWIHPTEGFIPPIKFIPIFENNGFIMKLDDYMITEVARLQGKWYAEGKELVPISVNVSRAHFTRDDLAEHICSIVDSFNVPHWAIELELTESAFFDDKDVLLSTVKKMKELGFAVSMDDFGAGYSSLNSLKELPLDVVKLDAEFFRGVQGNRGDLIVADTIALAKKLGMRIVAEGIETREQVDFLAQRECDLIQGYFFAKPMPVSEYEERAFGVKSGEDGNTEKKDKETEAKTE